MGITTFMVEPLATELITWSYVTMPPSTDPPVTAGGISAGSLKTCIVTFTPDFLKRSS